MSEPDANSIPVAKRRWKWPIATLVLAAIVIIAFLPWHGGFAQKSSDEYLAKGLSAAWLNHADEAIDDFTKAIQIDPHATLALFNRAEQYYMKGDYVNAIHDMDRLIEIDPQSALAYRTRGDFYFSSGNPSKALGDFSEAIKYDPQERDVYEWRGDVLAAMGDRQGAISDYTMALDSNTRSKLPMPTLPPLQDARAKDPLMNHGFASISLNRQNVDPDARTLFHRGQMYLAQGFQDNALADFDKALHRAPKYTDALLARGDIHSMKGQYDEAMSEAQSVLASNPKNATALNELGAINLRKKDYDSAISFFEAAIKANPKFNLPYLNMANAYNAQGQHDSAIEACTKSINLQATPEAYFNRALSEFAKGDNAATIADCTEAIHLSPDMAKAYNTRGNAYSRQSQYDYAIKDFDRSLQLNSESYISYFNRAEVQFARHAIPTAAADYSDFISRCIKTDPANTLLGWALGQRGLCYWSMRKPDLAGADFDRALELSPNDPLLYRNRGYYRSRSGRYADARGDFLKWVEIAPKDPVVLNDLARLMATCPDANIRDGKQAVDYATKACEISNWKVPQGLDTLAAAYAESGDFADAIKWQEKAVELMPEGLRDSASLRLKLYQSNESYREAAQPN